MQSLFLVARLELSKLWHVGNWSPDWGLNLGPLLWEIGVLATGPPGKSLHYILNERFRGGAHEIYPFFEIYFHSSLYMFTHL